MQYDVTEYDDKFGFSLRHGPVTGDVYQFVRLEGTNPDTTLITRIADMNTVKWAKYYQDSKSAYRSILIDSSETYIYLIMMHSFDLFTNLHSFYTENGTEAMAKRIQNSR